jgi:trehalose 6-phosphate phosphatase
MASPKSELPSEPRSAPPEELVKPFLDHPESSGLIFDVDGTLAPITLRPDDTVVPVKTRALLRRLERRYALVACISGRQATEARRIVGIESLTYVGNHGLEVLEPGATKAVTDASLPEYASRVRAFAVSQHGDELERLGIRLEDKDAIWVFHWRGAEDEEGARRALERVAGEAEREGLVPRWGRKVLEIRPPVAADKGTAVEAALDGRGLAQALYAGDDTTDLHAFRKLRELERAGTVRGLCVGVRSNEGPPAITDEADLVVDGPDGLVDLLELLVAE